MDGLRLVTAKRPPHAGTRSSGLHLEVQPLDFLDDVLQLVRHELDLSAGFVQATP
jgi:hypothetical protein